MKLFIISDIHGSLYYLKKVMEIFGKENYDKLVILGDELYHGPRNPLPKDYSPKEVIEIEKYKDELQELAKNKENSFVEIETRQNRIEEIAETVEHSKEVFAEIEEKIKSLTAEKEELVEKNKGFLNQREEISKHMSELDKECFRLNSKKEGCEEALEKSVNYMWEEYEITYSLANEMRDDSLTDPVIIRKQIQSLKGQIKALGSVNVNAIEDYRNVSERYEFLKTQHSDLVEAEATLVGIIEELDAAMRKQFAERLQS